MKQIGFFNQMHSLANIATSFIEQLGGDAANPIPKSWNHITKVDPEPKKQLPLLYPEYLQYTSAISVGGSQDVTPQNTEAVFKLLDYISTPVIHEPSAADHVTSQTRDKSNFLAIPEVLNGETKALIGTLGEGIDRFRNTDAKNELEAKLPRIIMDRYGEMLADLATAILLDTAIFEAYIIQNEESAAAREAGVGPKELLSPQEARQRGLAADRHLRSEIIYIEYSGKYGGEKACEIIETIAEVSNWSRVWYGGGLSRRDQVSDIASAGADAVVVGNIFHEIADEELSIYKQASNTFDSIPSTDEIGLWLNEEFSIESLAATRYLSTIPSVSNPPQTARRNLINTIQVWAAIDQLQTTKGPIKDRRTMADDFYQNIREVTKKGPEELVDYEEYLKYLMRSSIESDTDSHSDLAIGHLSFEPDVDDL